MAIPKAIYGGGGIYAGRFQFTTRTVISYVREMDGRMLSSSDALCWRTTTAKRRRWRST